MISDTLKGSLFFSLFCLSAIGYADTNDASQQSCGRGPKHMRLSARHIEGKGIGYDQGYTTLEAFLAPDQETSFIPFVDLRGHIFDNAKWAANAGLGTRWRWGCRAYGVNAYYDYREDRKAYHQAGVGLESLGRIWDFRINGYLPFGDKVSHPYQTRFSHFKEHNMILSQKFEFAMKGADAEGGAHFGSKDYHFFAGAGPYYYEGEIGPHAWGGKARVFAGWKEYIGVQVSASYDNVFHGIVQGEVFFSLPFGPRSAVKANNNHCQTTCCRAKQLDARMVQPVVRDEIIVLNKRRKHSVAINPGTDDPYFFWFVNNTSHSNGTFESPFNTLAAAQNASGPGDIIYVFPGDFTSNGMSSGITLQNGQQLLGATISHKLPTTAGAVKIKPQASGDIMPLLTNGTGNVVTLANDNVVSGFDIQNLNGQGITGTRINNATIMNNFIQGNGMFLGVQLVSVTGNVSVNNNTMMLQNHCVNIDNTLVPVANASYAIQNNKLDASTSMGATVNINDTNGSNNSYLVSGNQIFGNIGISVFCINTVCTLTITNNQVLTVSNPIELQFNSTNCNYSITDNSLVVTGITGEAIELASAFSSQLSGTISNNSMSSPSTALGIVTIGSTFVSDISNNNFNGLNRFGVVGVVIDSSVSTAIDFSNNVFTGQEGVSVVDQSSSPAIVNFTNNLFGSFANSPNSLTVTNNGSTNLELGVIGNTFQAFNNNAVNVQNSSGNICMQLNNNSSSLFPNAYFLSQTGGTFNLVTPQGNTGQLVEMGTITPVTSCP